MLLMLILFCYFGLIVAVAFLVLTERGVLGLAQIRKGPNTVGPWGVVQCVADRLKLMTKYKIYLSPTSKVLYTFSPVLLTILTIVLISTSPIPYSISHTANSILLIFRVLSLLSIPFILLGFAYGSVYSTVGSIRVVRLIMSYEILLLILIIFFKRKLRSWTWVYTTDNLMSNSNFVSHLPLIIPILVLWLIELGRTPFDLAERESELVSRFNVEYGRWRFLLFFFSEMLCLITISLIFSVLLIQEDKIILLIFWMIIFIIRSLCIRAALPRFRLIDTQNFVWFRLTPAVITIRVLIHVF